MQSESNHIDSFFRHKEAASIADKSKIDAHWKQMQEMMQTPAIPGVHASRAVVTKKFLLYAASVILIVASGLFLIMSNRNNDASKNENFINTINSIQTPPPSINVSNDSLLKVDISARKISIHIGNKKNTKQKT